MHCIHIYIYICSKQLIRLYPKFPKNYFFNYLSEIKKREENKNILIIRCSSVVVSDVFLSIKLIEKKREKKRELTSTNMYSNIDSYLILTNKQKF